MAYAFTKLDEYLRGRKGGSALPGSQSIGKGPTLPSGGGAKTSTGTQQTAGESTARSIFEKSGREGLGATVNRIVQPAARTQDAILAKYGAGGSTWKAGEEEKIKGQFATPSEGEISKTVDLAAGGDTSAAENLRGQLTVQPYTPPTPPQPEVGSLTPSEYLRSGDVGSYLQKTSGGRYTQGMGLIDALQASKQRAGAVIGRTLGGMQSNVRGVYEGMGASLPGLAETAKTLQESRRDAIKQAIESRRGTLDQAIATALETAKGGQSRADEAELAAIRGELSKRLGESAKAKGVSELLPPPDESKFYKKTTETKTLETPEIAQYNRLAEILGLPTKTAPTYEDVIYSPEFGGVDEFVQGQVPPPPPPPNEDKETGRPTDLPPAKQDEEREKENTITVQGGPGASTSTVTTGGQIITPGGQTIDTDPQIGTVTGGGAPPGPGPGEVTKVPEVWRPVPQEDGGAGSTDEGQVTTGDVVINTDDPNKPSGPKSGGYLPNDGTTTNINPLVDDLKGEAETWDPTTESGREKILTGGLSGVVDTGKGSEEKSSGGSGSGPTSGGSGGGPTGVSVGGNMFDGWNPVYTGLGFWGK